MSIVSEAPVAPVVPRLCAVNRGIAVAVVYALVLLVGGWAALPYYAAAEMRMALFALAGFVAGAIAGFSNTLDGESPRRDLGRNALDAAMVSLWTGIALLTLNLVYLGATVDWAGKLLGIFAIAALIGGAAGEPLLIFVSSLSIRGRRPFVAANRFCDRFHDSSTRFVAQVVLHSVAFIALMAAAAALAMVVLIIVAVIVTVVIGGWMLSAALSDGNQRTTRRRRSTSRNDDRPEPVFSLKPGQRIAADGRIVDEHWLGDTRTGKKINERGQVVDERWLGDEATGYRIAADGRVQREGFFFNDDLGVSVVPDGKGGQRVIKPGVFFDDDTNLRIDAKGRPIEQGVFFDDEQGFEIDADGKVRKI
ncbi:MAG TPA: hypothetical protein VF698_18715 [Thermoanaerobaculia bacterium]|jgi:hypothetical protein